MGLARQFQEDVDMGDCEYSSMLSPYFDGELDEIEQRRVERHLGYCEQCTEELERLGALSAVLLSIPTPIVPSASPSVHTVQSDNSDKAALARFVRRLTIVSAAAAALAL